MPVSLTMLVECDKCGQPISLIDHDRGDFHGGLMRVERLHWKVTPSETLCPKCWMEDRGTTSPPELPRRTCVPGEDRSENVYTMTVQRCGVVARMFGFKLHVIRTLGGQVKDGVWGVMITTDDGSHIDMRVARFLDPSPNHWVIAYMVQEALLCGIRNSPHGRLTHDSAHHHHDVEDVILIPRECQDEWERVREVHVNPQVPEITGRISVG